MRSRWLFSASLWSVSGCAYFEAPTDSKSASGATAAWSPTDTGAPVDTGTHADAVCPEPDGPISLAESWDRGFARIWFDGVFNIENNGPHDIQMDQWYVFFTQSSQDTAAGSASVTSSTETTTIHASELWQHNYTAQAGPAWWCVERTQQTTWAEDFRFTGAQVPPPILDFILTETDTNENAVEDHEDYPDPFTPVPQTQFNVWDAIAEGPVMAVGRIPNYLEMAPGQTKELTVEVVNLGRGTGTMQVTESIPAGFEVSDFSPLPERVESSSDGGTTVWWQFKLPGSVDDPDTSRPTDYGKLELNYSVTMRDAECGRRHTSWAPEVHWQDIWERPHTSVGTPLVIACCE